MEDQWLGWPLRFSTLDFDYSCFLLVSRISAIAVSIYVLVGASELMKYADVQSGVKALTTFGNNWTPGSETAAMSERNVEYTNADLHTILTILKNNYWQAFGTSIDQLEAWTYRE